MVRSQTPARAERAPRETGTSRPRPRLGPALRRAWVGYQLQLDEQLAEAGFGDRALPDGRVLRLCRPRDVTISDIGRELGMTRQGASKLVAGMRDRGYVTLEPSTRDAREKVVRLTPHARAYLDAQRAAARRIERNLRAQLGPDGVESLFVLLETLAADDDPRLRDYLRTLGIREL